MVFVRSFLCWILFSTIAIAAELPEGCKPLTVKGDKPSFSVTSPSLLILMNVTDDDLWLTHPEPETGASAGWNSKLQSGQFSALVLNQEKFVLQCIESTPGHEQHIPCQGALAVCIWKTVKIPRNEVGTFWAVEDKRLAALKLALIKRNFIFPEKSVE